MIETKLRCAICLSEVSMVMSCGCGFDLCERCIVLHDCDKNEYRLAMASVEICSCPVTGTRLRRSETRGATQRDVDARCVGAHCDEPCYAGCSRSHPNLWLYQGRDPGDV